VENSLYDGFWCLFQGLMVVGFDVCHDTSSKSESYGAMVASLDKSFSRYFSAVSAHTSGEELSNDLTSNIASESHVCSFYVLLPF
jgi:aubergine-like protein